MSKLDSNQDRERLYPQLLDGKTLPALYAIVARQLRWALEETQSIAKERRVEPLPGQLYDLTSRILKTAEDAGVIKGSRYREWLEEIDSFYQAKGADSRVLHPWLKGLENLVKSMRNTDPSPDEAERRKRVLGALGCGETAASFWYPERHHAENRVLYNKHLFQLVQEEDY